MEKNEEISLEKSVKKNTYEVCKLRAHLFCKGMKAKFGFLNDCAPCKK